MFRARVCAYVGLGLMLASIPAQAREIELFVENRLGGDSNVFRRRTDESSDQVVEDGFWEFSPRITLSEAQDDLTYFFRYQPTYEQFFEAGGSSGSNTSNISGWDQNGRANVDWRVTRADTLGMNATYNNTRRLRQFADELATDPDPLRQPSDNERTKRARANAYYRTAFTSALSARLDYFFDDFDYSKRTISDSRSHTGSLRFDYVYDPLTTVGISAAARFRNSRLNQQQVFGVAADPVREVRSRTDSYDMALSIRRALTKTVNLSLQAGPTWFTSQQEATATTVPGANPGDPPIPIPESSTSSSTLSFFAAVDLEKAWKHGSAALRYSRYESGGGGTSASSIVDRVTLDGRYSIDRVWTLMGVVSWNRRKDAVDNLAIGDDELEQWNAIATVQRRLAKNLDAIVRFQYRLQTQRNDIRVSDSEIYTGYLAIRYTFDPFVF